MQRLAYVVSSHGFGHAARACAVIEALWSTHPDLQVTILGRTPEWFFHQSLGAPGEVGNYQLVEADTDVGLVQTSALREDAPATARQLAARLPFERHCRPLTDAIRRADAEIVVCDISPWGLVAAYQLELPSVLVENFTWDWIYAGYPELEDFVEPVRRAFARASRRVQTEPVCVPGVRGSVVKTPPVSRRPRTDRWTVRRQLGVGADETLVMLTMGGVAWDYQHLESLDAETQRVWVIAGGTPGGIQSTAAERRGRHWLLPHRSPLYHPDLVHAADVVVGKLGYSTVAEVAAAGTRLVYVPRPTFPESDRLEAWVGRYLSHRRVEPEVMEAGDWLSAVGGAVDGLAASPSPPPRPHGAALVARAVLSAQAR